MRTYVAVKGTNLSDAWARTLLAVATEDRHRACHVITHIASTDAEDPQIRDIADRVLAHLDLAPVTTVANTLFPQAVASRSADSKELAARYLKVLPTIKDLDRENARGTYFERLVSYPTAKGSVDQLTELIRRLKVEQAVAESPSRTGAKTARFEVALEHPTAALPVHEPEHDTYAIGFPCLSLLSFQLDDGHVHALAHYRSHYLVQRAYGNYLAVCGLLRYVAEEAGLVPGEVTIVAGYAQVDQHSEAIVRMVRDYLTHDVLI